MSTIRRVLSGISSAISRTRLEVDAEPLTPLTPHEPLQPIQPVRRGFSDQSDFQADVEDVDGSLAAHAPNLVGAAGDSSFEPAPEQLRVFSGESSFESGGTRSRYAQLLGSQLPSSLGAPQERVGGVSSGRGRGVGGTGVDDLLSPDTAAWELQNLDTSPATAVEPEDLLFMLDAPAPTGLARQPHVEDVFEDGPAGISSVDAARSQDVAPIEDATLDALDVDALPYLTPEELDPAVRPAGPDEFLADTNDLGSLVPEEPSVGDAALAGVLAPVVASPAAATAPVSAALASQSVEAVADSFEVEPAAQATVDPGAAQEPAAQTAQPTTTEG